MSTRQRIKYTLRFERTTMDKLILFFTDPIGSINTQIRRYMGWKTQLEVQVFTTHPSFVNTTLLDEEISNYWQNLSSSDFTGLKLTLRW